MGYLHIGNLYKAQDILLFKRCYAMEKIHGTSAHVQYKDGMLTYFSGGGKHAVFMELFAPHDDFKEKFVARGYYDITIYGEFYGGSLQGMKATYGDKQRFVAFDVRIVDSWLSVPKAAAVLEALGIEMVHWVEIPTDMEAIDAQRDMPSAQAIRNGCGNDKKAEGVVLRPLIELTDNRGDRIIVKHKRADFEERKTPQRVVDPNMLTVLRDAKAIAEEWVVPRRLEHVLDKIPGAGLEHMRAVLEAMCEDVKREAGNEIVWSKDVMAAINRRAATMFKRKIMEIKSDENT